MKITGDCAGRGDPGHAARVNLSLTSPAPRWVTGSHTTCYNRECQQLLPQSDQPDLYTLPIPDQRLVHAFRIAPYHRAMTAKERRPARALVRIIAFQHDDLVWHLVSDETPSLRCQRGSLVMGMEDGDH